MSVFESENTLGKCLRSITPFVDRLLAIDGAYEGFSDHVESRDNTLLLLMGFQKPYGIQKPHESHFFRSEMHKRNQYLFQGYLDAGDWLLIIDADEYIVSGVEETLQLLEDATEPYYAVTVTDPLKDNPDWARNTTERVRLIRYVPGMRYVGNHWTIKYPDGGMVPLKAKLAPLVLCHDDRRVPDAYKRALDRYNRDVRPNVESE